MNLVQYVDRKNTSCQKWDAQTAMYGEEGLHAMWIADMDFKAPPCVVDALTSYAQNGVYGYYKVSDTYYQSFVQWEEKEHGYRPCVEELRFSPGVVPGLNWIVQMMTQKKDAIIVLTPVYYPFLHAVTNNERTLITSALINTNGYYTIDFEDFEQKIVSNNVKLFIFCSPHNPVGRVWSKEEINKLITICERHNVFIISDEIHHDLTYYSDKPHVPTLSLQRYHHQLIALTAPSKSFNLAGCQNSILMIPNQDLREKWDKFTTKMRLQSGNAFGYIAATAAYTNGKPWLDETRQIIHENALYVENFIKEHQLKITVSPLEGTYLLWLDFREELPAKEVPLFLQKECHLALDLGEWFGGDEFLGFARMNLATCRKNVEIALLAIYNALCHRNKE